MHRKITVRSYGVEPRADGPVLPLPVRRGHRIVYSATLQAPDTARTQIDRDFDPVQVRKLKEAAGIRP